MIEPTNTGKPNYEWEYDEQERTLYIYSECCADTFSEDQLLKLYETLKTKHFGEL